VNKSLKSEFPGFTKGVPREEQLGQETGRLLNDSAKRPMAEVLQGLHPGLFTMNSQLLLSSAAWAGTVGENCGE